jgi:hypothetical protein
MKKFAVIMCLLGVVALASSARAAIGQQLWVQRYNGPGNGDDSAYGIATDADGNVFVTGKSIGTATYTDYLTIKYSGSGVPLWTNRYHGPVTGNSAAFALVVDGNGDVIVTGESTGSGSSTDYATVKYSGEGDKLWANRYSPTVGSASARAIAVDTNANIYVTGETQDAIVTIKYSAAGATLWTKSYAGPAGGTFDATGIAVDDAGNAFVSASTPGLGTGKDFVTIAYKSGGNPWWTNRYTRSGNDDDYAKAIALDSNGSVFVTGTVVVGGMPQFATFKYSNAGIPLWTNFYPFGSTIWGGAQDIAVDVAGDVLITGSSNAGDTYNDFVTIKYSNAGVPLWTNIWNRLYNDAALALTTDKSANVFVTGLTDDDNGISDRLTIAYSAAGAPLWTNRYDGPAKDEDFGSAIAVDLIGNVFVTGYSTGTGFNGLDSNPDFAINKYAGVQSIPLTTEWANNKLVLTWANPVFHLQSAPTVTATFTNIPSATSPYTNSAASPRYFRLKIN